MNNFNSSNTGLSVDCNISFDTFVSQIDFEENFVKLRGDTYQYVNCGNIEKMENNELITINLISLKMAREMEEGGIVQGVFEEDYEDKEDFISDLKRNIFYEYEDLKELIEVFNAYEVDYIENYEHYISRGYSQGDALEIIIPHKLKEIWGYEGDLLDKEITSDIDHLLWDVPLYAHITINEEEININDFLEDRYTYDKEEVIQITLTQYEGDRKEELEEILNDLLPDYPSYD